MAKYVALLRGINVGGRVIGMADLKSCFEGLGFENVTTVLQSGNVLFETGQTDLSKLQKTIEAGLSTKFNYPAKVQVLGLDNLRKIVVAYPFGTPDPDQHDYVIFMENGLEKSMLDEEYVLAKGEQVKDGKGVIYWRVDKGSTLKSSFAKLLTKPRYRYFNTNRNLKTLLKLL